MPTKKPSIIRRALIKAAQTASLVFPVGVRKKMAERFYYSIFQSTRVTNDAYGWRPEKEENSP